MRKFVDFKTMRASGQVRKLGVIGVIVMGILLATLWYAPTFFEQQVHQKVQQTLAQRLDAKASYTDYALSFFPNFPDLTLSLTNFRLEGNAPFTGTDLIKTQNLRLSLNFWAFLQGSYQLTNIRLEQAQIELRTTTSGAKNYAILLPPDPLEKDWRFEVESWEIQDGSLSLTEAGSQIRLQLKDLKHAGRGEVWNERFEWQTTTEASLEELRVGKKQWLRQQALSWEGEGQWDTQKKQLSCQENALRIGELAFLLDGTLTPETVAMELSATQLELAALAAVLPPPLDSLSLGGKTDLLGLIRGHYDLQAGHLPELDFSGTLQEGAWTDSLRFWLPLQALRTDWRLRLPNDSTQQLTLNNLEGNWGEHQIKGRVQLDSLSGLPTLDAQLDLTLRMDKLPKTDLLPDSLKLYGSTTGRLAAEGKFSPKDSLFPAFRADFQWKEGRLEWQADSLRGLSWEEVSANYQLVYDPKQDSLNLLRLESGSLSWDGQRTQLKGELRGGRDTTFLLDLKGAFPLPRLKNWLDTSPEKLEGVLGFSGRIEGDFSAHKGLSWTPDGTFSLTDFHWQDTAHAPRGIRIPGKGQGIATKEEFRLERTENVLWGDNTVEVSGAVKPFPFGRRLSALGTPSEVQLLLKAEYVTFDPKDWQVWQKRARDQQWQIRTDFDELSVEGVALQDWRADLKTNADGGWLLENAYFTWWKGNGTATGRLTADKFSLELSLENAPLPKTAALGWLSHFLPLAQQMRGTATGTLMLSGSCRATDDLQRLTSTGDFKLYEPRLNSQTPLLKALREFSTLSELSEVSLAGKSLRWTLEKGRMVVQPLSFRLGTYEALFDGSTQAKGGLLNYRLDLRLPVGEVSQAQLVEWFGQEEAGWLKSSTHFTLPMRITGTAEQPKVEVVQ